MAADLRERIAVSEPGFGPRLSEAQAHKKKNLQIVALTANQGVVFTRKQHTKGSHLPREISSNDKGHL